MIFYMQIIIVKIEVFGLEKSIRMILKICKSLVLNLFNVGFYELP